jgi:hypothetical protein
LSYYKLLTEVIPVEDGLVGTGYVFSSVSESLNVKEEEKVTE